MGLVQRADAHALLADIPEVRLEHLQSATLNLDALLDHLHHSGVQTVTELLLAVPSHIALEKWQELFCRETQGVVDEETRLCVRIEREPTPGPVAVEHEVAAASLPEHVKQLVFCMPLKAFLLERCPIEAVQPETLQVLKLELHAVERRIEQRNPFFWRQLLEWLISAQDELERIRLAGG